MEKPRWSTGYCPACVSARWYEKSDEERKAVTARTNATTRARKARDPEYRRRINVQQNAKRYGLTVAAYEDMLTRPCAICERTMTETGKRFSVDHDHESGTVRDVLCLRCNLALGQFGEDLTRLRNAVAYLERHMLKGVV